MNHIQDSKGYQCIFLRKKGGWGEKGKLMIQARDSPEQPGLGNKRQQKLTLLPLSSPCSWASCLGLAGTGQIAAFGIQILNIFFSFKARLSWG